MMYIITTGLNPNESYICHYGRKGMKWGEHIYSREDIKRLKKFMRTKEAKADSKAQKEYVKNEESKVGYKRGLFRDSIKKDSELVRYTTTKNEKVKGRTYASLNNTVDSLDYASMAQNGQLGDSRGMTEYTKTYADTYTATKKLYVAKGEKVTKDIIRKYGDKNLKEIYAMYKDLNVRDKQDYMFSNYDKGGKEMIELLSDVGKHLNKLLYSNDDVKSYIDNKYRKLGYDAITDAEDYVYGMNHPLIVYDPEKNLKKKSSKKIW